MNDTAPPPEAASGRLAENIAVFARVLRDSGLPVGPAHAVDAVRAVEAAGIGSRTDVYAALRAVFVHRRDEIAVFDAAFDAFFRGRNMLDKMMELLSPVVDERKAPEKPRAASARVAQALNPPRRNEQRERPDEVEVDARLTSSDREILRTKDFAQMSAAELEVARRAIARLAFDADRVATRRRDRRAARALRSAPLDARGDAHRRRAHQSAPHDPRSEAAARRRAVRHFRLHGGLFAHRPPLPACPGRAAARRHLPVRHAPHQRHPRPHPPRSGRGALDVHRAGRRLVRRHTHRRGAGALQPRLVAPGACRAVPSCSW